MLTTELPADKAVDLEGALSIELIRSHTKTDDAPHVTDDLLRLYRKAAVEQAELYTGRVWGSARTVTQSIATRAHSSRFRRRTRIDLDYPALEGFVTLYGGSLASPVRIDVAPGTTRIDVPVMSETMDGCCSPCGAGVENFGLRAIYRTGVNCGADIPSGIVLGCLKYIAWTIANPGDVLATMNNGTSNGASGVGGTNNAAWASGAIEQWRTYKRRVAA